jgi:hypothetical protein
MKLLNDKNVWIIDNGAIKSCQFRRNDKPNCARNSHTSMGNGSRVATKGIGEIPVTV